MLVEVVSDSCVALNMFCNQYTSRFDFDIRCVLFECFFFFQAEDGIRDAQESRGLGDVYKRQPECRPAACRNRAPADQTDSRPRPTRYRRRAALRLSLIHI